MFLKKKSVAIWLYIIVILLYSLFTIFYLRSLLSGNNLMKWDIWDAEYPLEVIMSDAFRHGTAPLWNPLMRMGTPHYAMVGTPVWYPVTMVSELIGTTPSSVAYIYGFHIVLGAFGMFLLIKYFLEECSEKNIWNILTAFVGGIFFGYSGVFLSNAQHIMIIISAAWIPFVFYFVKRYLSEKALYLAMAAGLCAGMLILGGYPEIFYDLFLILVIYVLYFNWKKEKKIFQNIVNAAGKYLLICVFTVLACAITLIPFLHVMPYLTRTANAEQQVLAIPVISLLSFLMPAVPRLFDGEPSMYNFYTGILAVVTIPCAFQKSNRHKVLFGGLTLVSFIMCLGKNSPLYMVLHKVAPMYATFRFPTVNRIFMTLFLILFLAQIWKEFLESAKKWSYIILTAVWGVLGAVGWVVATKHSQYLLKIFPLWSEQQIAIFAEGAKILSFIAFFYCIAFLISKGLGKKWKILHLGVVAVACLEVMLFANTEFPITVATYEQDAAANNSEVRQAIDEVFKQHEQRNQETNFVNNQRTSSGLYSTLIANQKTFDDEGYVSIRLANVDSYLQTMNHSIIESNPVLYMTNDVVTETEEPYEIWAQKADVPAEQIHVERRDGDSGKDFALKSKELEKIECDKMITGSTLTVTGNFDVLTDQARVIKAYVEDSEDATKMINAAFIDVDGIETSYAGSFQVISEGDDCYVQLYFPDTKKQYQSVTLTMTEGYFVDGYVCRTERMTNSEDVLQKEFSFNNIEVETNALANGYLVLLQANYPGWHVYVDGQEANIETINQCFMGVYLTAGNHTVEFRFLPIDFYIGLVITCAFFVCFLIAIFMRNGKVWKRVNQIKEKTTRKMECE